MESQKTIVKVALFMALQLIMVMINSIFCSASILGNQTDNHSLLEFKFRIVDDPDKILSSWNESQPHCQWPGVMCGRKHQRVTALDLSGHNLFGPISPHIGNLSFLRSLNLINNKLHGEIPQEMGRLFRLNRLNLANNTLGGGIPLNISNCKELNVLILGGNKLTGKIPASLGSLKKLVALSLNSNYLGGKIPQSLGNLSSLQQLSLAYNNLQESIPNEISKLTNLTFFAIGVNNLSGTIPHALYNISSVNIFSVASNQLIGTLPADIGSTLPNLVRFEIGGNKFTGTLPTSLANASHLQSIDILVNSFTGQVPNNIGALTDLQHLHIGLNQLGNNSTQDLSFLVPLSNCSKLNFLHFNENNFGGQLPDSVANLSTQLNQLAMGRNPIYGSIPETIGRLTNLYLLEMEYNLLSGVIPSSLGGLLKLQSLVLNDNQLSGEIPSSLGNITELSVLSLSRNKLEGEIPTSIGDCQRLKYLDLSQNNLFRMIPPQVIGIPSLSVILNLSQNSLSGPLPAEVGNLISLNMLDFSGNKLSGEIPASIGDCLSLEYLSMQGNNFSGSIPPTLASLKGLQYLDLSRNNLSGKIPPVLGSLAYLQILNLSFNNLEGEIPMEKVFGNASAISVSGNSKLCGGIIELEKPPCPTPTKKKLTLKLIIVLICAVLFLIGVTSFFVLYWRRKTREVLSSAVPEDDKLMRISYRELHIATNGFSSENSIGSGSFGTVYKGKLNQRQDKLIAVKVFNLQNSRASKSFMAECKVLQNVRHRNLLKILTYCSSIDSRRNDFKALVYEFMPNGNLDMWLHPDEGNSAKTLSLLQRLNIAIDIACALQYLHNDCEPPIVHCDLKPSNILLDNEMCANVGDFGLARFLPKVTTSHSETSSIGIKGSFGYVAPEYGTGDKVSAYGDIYSYGILLLEMFTGKRPTDDIFNDGLDLRNYVKKALLNQVRSIVDPTVYKEHKVAACEEDEGEKIEEIVEIEEDEGHIGSASTGQVKLKTSIVSVLQIALACSEEYPRQRTDINDVIGKLHRVKGAILESGRRRTRHS